MAYYNKIGLLVLNENQTKFLVCEKSQEDMTTDYIMPGGQIESGEDDLQCLKREIKEELNCEINYDSLEFVGEYTGPAAGAEDRELYMKLYKGSLIGIPKPSDEIKFIHWIGKVDMTNPKVSLFIKTRILPDLIKRSILK